MADAKDTQVNEAAFLKALNKKKAAAKAAAKAERPSGILNDLAIMKRLGLEEENDTITVNARVSKIKMGFAKGDTGRPYFQFGYSLSEDSPTSGKGKGLILSNYHELTEAEKDGEVWRTEEEAYEKMFWEFQALGEVTADWTDPLGEAVECAKKHTANKTEIQLSLKVYSGRNGLGLNKSVVNVIGDNSDLGDDSTEDEEETTDAAESEEASWEDWIGGWVKWEDDDGAVEFQVQSYDAESESFTGTDAEGDEWTCPCSVAEWCDDQRDE